MVNAYLYLNAILYLLLAGWCTFAPTKTAAAVGFVQLSRSGQSEYLVIYGGLQLGMAFLFAWFAYTQQPRNGLVVALAFYLPIVVYRCATLVKWWPVEPTTLALAVVEWVFLLAGAALLWRLRTP